MTLTHRNKYNARKATLDGYSFDSQAEARRYMELRMLVWSNIIEGLQIHPSFVLLDQFEYRGKKVRGITYEADFSYYEGGTLVVEDVKGVRTKEFLLKEKLFKVRYPHIDFRILD